MIPNDDPKPARTKKLRNYLNPPLSPISEDDLNELLKNKKKIGKGAWGYVYEAFDKSRDKNIAVKLMSKSDIRNNHHEEYLKNEVAHMYKLDHPNIIRIYTHHENSSDVYFLMELAEKGGLHKILKKTGPLTEELAKKCVLNMVEAIECLHSQTPKIIHRDIKPANILVDKHDIFKLADFGWSQIYMDIKRDTTCGTTEYRAPEMFEEGGHDTGVDYWSLGVVVYEILTGKKAFAVTPEDMEKAKFIDPTVDGENVLISKIMEVNYTFPPNFPKGAQDLIERLLRKNPADRLTAKEVLNHPWVQTGLGT